MRLGFEIVTSFLQVDIRPLRPNKEEMAHSSTEGLFFDEVDEDFEAGIGGEKRSGDSKMEEATDRVHVRLCTIL